MNLLEQIFLAVLAASWQASVLVVFVLLAQRLLGAKLNPRWRYALWLLVVLRLLLPVLPSSAVSVYRVIPDTPPSFQPPAASLEIPPPPLTPQSDIATLPHDVTRAVDPRAIFNATLALTWLTGVLLLTLATALVNRRFARHVTRAPQITDPLLLEIFHSAKTELAIRRPVRLIESTQISSPAILGLFTPTLLLPGDARDKFTPRELRYIFLHELAHLKRGDVLVQALIALLQIIHWFNPVLWYAFRRLRADREPATDALVLSRTGEADREPYGLMLLKLLEHFHQRHALPTLVGILEDKDQFKQRFTLIARFTRRAYAWSLLGVALLALLAAICLTKANDRHDTSATASKGAPIRIQFLAIDAPADAFTGPHAADDALKDYEHNDALAGTSGDSPRGTRPINRMAEHIRMGQPALWISGPNGPGITAECTPQPNGNQISLTGTLTLNSQQGSGDDDHRKLTLMPILGARYPINLNLDPEQLHALNPEGILEPAAALHLNTKAPRRLFVYLSAWPESEADFAAAISAVQASPVATATPDEPAPTTPATPTPLPAIPGQYTADASPIPAGQNPLLNLDTTFVEMSDAAYKANAKAIDTAIANGDLDSLSKISGVHIAPKETLALPSGKGWYSAGVVQSYIGTVDYSNANGKTLTTLNAKAIFLGLNADFHCTVLPDKTISITSLWNDYEPATAPVQPPGANATPAKVPSQLELAPKMHVTQFTNKNWLVQPGQPHAFWIGPTLGQYTRTSWFHDPRFTTFDSMAHNKIPSRLAVVLTAHLPASSTNTAPGTNTGDIAAKVNNHVITHQDLQIQWQATENSVRANLTGDRLQKQLTLLHQSVLKAMIDRWLIIDDFKANGGFIPRAYIDERINDIIHDQFGGDRAAYLQTLAQRGVTLDHYREEIEDNAIVGYSRNRNVAQKVHDYWQQHPELFSSEDRLSVTVLEIPGSQSVPGNRTGKFSDETDPQVPVARRAFAALKAGDNLSPFAQDGVDRRLIGTPVWVAKDGQEAGVPGYWPFNWDTIASLKPGETTDVAVTDYQYSHGDAPSSNRHAYWMLRLNERRPAAVPASDAIHAQEKTVISEKAQEYQTQWLQPLRAKAKIQILDPSLADAALGAPDPSPDPVPLPATTTNTTSSPNPSLNLTGDITEPNGTPVPNAKVIVHECGSRPGLKAYTPGSPDPSLDFKKTGLGDAQGRFVLGNVSHDVLFTLIADAPGHGPAVLENVDPKAGPVHFILPPLLPGQDGAPACGHLLDDQGRPVANAQIVRVSFSEGGTTHYTGGVGPRVVGDTTSDSGGNFSLPFAPGHQAAGVEIVATGFARQIVSLLPFNGLPTTIHLHPGVTVTGRLLDHGAPLRGVEIGIAQTNGAAETNTGEITATTGPDGRFALPDVAANDEHEIYAKRDSLGLRGVPVRKIVKTGAQGSSLDIGELALKPGVRLEGQITFPNGAHPVLHQNPIQLHVSRDSTCDYQYINLGPDLKFTVLVQPGEIINLTAWIDGYHLAAPNAALEVHVTPNPKSVEMPYVPDDKPADTSPASTTSATPPQSATANPPIEFAVIAIPEAHYRQHEDDINAAVQRGDIASLISAPGASTMLRSQLNAQPDKKLALTFGTVPTPVEGKPLGSLILTLQPAGDTMALTGTLTIDTIRPPSAAEEKTLQAVGEARPTIDSAQATVSGSLVPGRTQWILPSGLLMPASDSAAPQRLFAFATLAPEKTAASGPTTPVPQPAFPGQPTTLSLQDAIDDDNLDAARARLDAGEKPQPDDMARALGFMRTRIVKLFWERSHGLCSPLTYAISQGATAGDVEKTLKAGSTVHPPEDKLITPLAVAAVSGNLPVVELLLKNGGNPNDGAVTSSSDFTPLHRAVALRHADIVSLLLDHGATPDATDARIAVMNCDPENAAAANLHAANLRTLQLLANHGALERVPKDQRGNLLTLACLRIRDMDVVRLLLAHGFDPHDSDATGRTNVLQSVRNAVAGKDNWPADPFYAQALAELEHPGHAMTAPSVPGTYVTISGKLQFAHPGQLDLAKTTGYLTGVDGGTPITFVFQPNGAFTIPHVKPGTYNRHVRFIGKSGAATEWNLDPVAVDASAPAMTMNLDVDARLAAPQKSDIAIALKLIEIDDAFYLANKTRVDEAVDKADIGYFNNLQGTSLLSCPMVTTQAGLKANVDIVKEFPYPTSFEPGKVSTMPAAPGNSIGATNVTLVVPPTPREFATQNIGVSAEITPTINPPDSPSPGKIVLQGRVSVTDFNGFTSSNVTGVNMPSFTTNESLFLEQLDEQQLKGVWVPGLYVDQPLPDKKSPAAKPNTAVKRLLVFVSASRANSPP